MPGIGDLIEPGRTGVLVTPESSSDLAAAIQRMLLNERQTEQMANAAKRRANDFAWELIAQRHLDLYTQLVSDRRTASKAA